MAKSVEVGVEAQKNFIAIQLQKPLVKGDVWYVTDAKWIKQWKSYVGYEAWDHYNVGEESSHPGPIDNTPIFQDGSKTLKKHLIDDLDYTLIKEEGWNKLLSWYGMAEGQESLPRKVIEEGVYTKSLKVEIYLWHLKICENSKPDVQLTKQFSRSDTIDTLAKVMRAEFCISADKEVRLWNRYMTNMYEPINKIGDNLQDAGLYQGQVIVIEQMNIDGTWPRGAINSKQTANTSEISNIKHTEDKPMDKSTKTKPSPKSGADYSGRESTMSDESREDALHIMLAGRKPRELMDVATDLPDKETRFCLAKKLSDVYENEWTAAFNEVKKDTQNDKVVASFLFEIIQKAYRKTFDESICQINVISNFMKNYLESGETDSSKHPCRSTTSLQDSYCHESVIKCRNELTEVPVERFKTEFLDYVDTNSKFKPMTKAFAEKCIEVTWSMAVLDPPMHVVDGQSSFIFDDNVYTPCTKTGRRIEFIVWPALQIYKDGPILTKGVVQCKATK